MTPVIEAILVAFLAGTLASLVASSINRGIARVKRRRKLRKGRDRRARSRAELVELVELVELGGVGVDPTLFRHLSDTSGSLYIGGSKSVHLYQASFQERVKDPGVELTTAFPLRFDKKSSNLKGVLSTTCLC